MEKLNCESCEELEAKFKCEKCGYVVCQRCAQEDGYNCHMHLLPQMIDI